MTDKDKEAERRLREVKGRFVTEEELKILRDFGEELPRRETSDIEVLPNVPDVLSPVRVSSCVTRAMERAGRNNLFKRRDMKALTKSLQPIASKQCRYLLEANDELKWVPVTQKTRHQMVRCLGLQWNEDYDDPCQEVIRYEKPVSMDLRLPIKNLSDCVKDLGGVGDCLFRYVAKPLMR